MRRVFSICVGLLTIFATSVFAGNPVRFEDAVQDYHNGYFDRAKTAFQDLLSSPDQEADAQYYLGKIAYKYEAFDRAIKHLEAAVKQDPEKSVAHQWLGRAYAQKAVRSNLIVKARLAGRIKKHLQQAVKLDPDNTEASLDLLRFYLVAPRIFGGNESKAAELAAKLRAKDKKQGHRAWAFVHIDNGDLESAEQEFLTAIRLYPDNQYAYYCAGRFYFEQERYEDARRVFEQALAVNPEFEEARFFAGYTTVLASGNIEAAVAHLEAYREYRPREYSPARHWARYALGRAYEAAGNPDLARREYAAALAFLPSHKESKDALKTLSSEAR